MFIGYHLKEANPRDFLALALGWRSKAISKSKEKAPIWSLLKPKCTSNLLAQFSIDFLKILCIFIWIEGTTKKGQRRNEKKKSRVWSGGIGELTVGESAKGLETDSHPWQAHLYFNLFLQNEDLSVQWKQKEWQLLPFLPQFTLLREELKQLPEFEVPALTKYLGSRSEYIYQLRCHCYLPTEA